MILFDDDVCPICKGDGVDPEDRDYLCSCGGTGLRDKSWDEINAGEEKMERMREMN
jgi:hypothetical protein